MMETGLTTGFSKFAYGKLLPHVAATGWTAGAALSRAFAAFDEPNLEAAADGLGILLERRE